VIRVLFAGGADRWAQYKTQLEGAFAAQGLSVDMGLQQPPDKTDYIIYAPNAEFSDFSRFPKVKLVQSLWAGVEMITVDPTLTQPLARMVDAGLTEGMTEWVLGHVLRHHLGMDRHIVNPDHIWDPTPPPLARSRRVAVLGLGALGAACAEALTRLGFQVLGWSRSQKDLPNVQCYAGEAGLREVLSAAEIIVLLLPLTSATTKLLNATRLGRIPRGAVILNPGRGPLIDDEALLDALGSGQIAHATLDVFREEPLPRDHPFWSHPSVTVTPHIASETRPETAALVVAENIARVEAGQPPLHLVDRRAGY
jgi:glyoxylate/hydroxypyruvate reductase A